ncbi:glycosyltransferase [Erwinia pyri]|uniref:Glycosyltransferase n=1 Tax=Erwinia pyri TaxID=3062598 RepID=A0AA50DQH2_9GAMM|nr:glycosyltransferase [Erwinia sp. DE2]WLS80311.1 glycosyltransferase [Erwinia sp. DE2]
MKPVFALVVTFKRKQLLEEVLTALLQQSTPLHKIIVVDNNSNDGTSSLVEQLSQLHAGKFEYHNTGANLGGAGGFAYGFELLKEREYGYLWLMDDDLKPEPDCLERLLACPEGDIVQPLRLNKDGSLAELSPIQFDLDDFFALSPKKENVSQFIARNNLTTGTINIAGVPFEGPLIKKHVVDRVGIPDKRFFIFYDDMDYSLRSTKAGFKIVCDLSAKAIRLLNNNQKNDLSSWKGYFMLRNLFRLYFIHGKKPLTKAKPFILAGGYCLLSLARLRFKEAKICLSSLKDSVTFNTNKKYIP